MRTVPRSRILHTSVYSERIASEAGAPREIIGFPLFRSRGSHSLASRTGFRAATANSTGTAQDEDRNVIERSQESFETGARQADTSNARAAHDEDNEGGLGYENSGSELRVDYQ